MPQAHRHFLVGHVWHLTHPSGDEFQSFQPFNRFAQFKTFQANIRSKSSKVPVVPIVRLQSRNKPSVNVRDLVSVAISPEGRTGRTNLEIKWRCSDCNCGRFQSGCAFAVLSFGFRVSDFWFSQE